MRLIADGRRATRVYGGSEMSVLASGTAEEPDRGPGPSARSARQAARHSRLVRAAQRGDARSRELLVASQLGLVRSVASRYRDLGLTFDDLVQEGSLGLLDAIDHYDRRRGCSFESYARFRVRRAIRNALTDQARLIRLPKQMVERRRAIARAEARLAAEGSGDRPTPAELAADTGLSAAAVVDARSAGLAPISLDQPLRPDGSSLESVMADPDGSDPELTAIEHEQAEMLKAALARLPERQRRIVSLRWGIGGHPLTNAEIATELKLSPRRAQEIGTDALYELRAALEPAEARR
jgi:RNA polymerase sigma factor (sigma-70 family)